MARLPDKADPKDLARFSRQAWTDLDAFYNFWLERWRRTMDFLRSQHWRTLQITLPDSIPDWEEWPVVGLTEAMYADYLRQWLQAKQRFSAIPDSSDSQEVSAAELADHILAYQWDKLVEPIKPEIGAWLLATGNAPIRVFWDRNTGNMVPLAEQGPPDQNGNPTMIPINPKTMKPDPTMKEPVLVDAGEIGVEALSPQLNRWPVARAHGTMVGFLIAYDDAVDRYGETIAKKLKYEGAHSTMMPDLLTIDQPGTVPSQMDRALVIEHYLPRSARYPTGLWWTASGTDLITDPKPLPSKEIPVINMIWVPMPGHPRLGTTPLYGVRAANKVYEKSLKRTLEWQNKVVPKRLLPIGGGIKRGDITNEPAQDVPYNVGAKPEYTSIPQPPDTFERLRGEALQVIKTVGLYGFERQKETPPGVSLQRFRQPQQALNENEEVQLAVINSAPAWTKLGYIILDFVARFYSDERSIGIVGPDRTYQWVAFKGSDLANLRATLRIDETSLYTWNKQTIRDTVIGLLGTPAGQLLFADDQGGVDRDRLDAAFEAAGLEQGFRSLDSDVLEARNENNAFKSLQQNQEPPKVMPWQNHATHLAEHTKEMKGLMFRATGPAIQQLLMEHVQQHEQAQQALAQQQQQTMLDQERSMRMIRMETESAGESRTAMATALAKLLVDMLSPQEVAPPAKKK